MLIKNVENKIKLALVVSVLSFVSCCIIVVFVLTFAFKLINEERKNVYVLDNGNPLLIQRMNVEANEEIEAKSHVNIFHSLFWTLPPDDEFIKNNLSKAMYLVDESGLKQYNSLKEQGYYNAILANSMSLSIKTDSIEVNLSDPMQFTYYGTQRIERPTSILKRRLITTGYLRKVQRSDNNPHGLIITNWRTLRNEDIESRPKKVF